MTAHVGRDPDQGQPGRFGASDARPQHVVIPVRLISGEGVRNPVRRRGRQQHGTVGRRRQVAGSACPAPVPAHVAHGLSERIGAVRLVQHHQAVISRQPGVNRPHCAADPVAAEQKARPELVHRGHDDRGLEGRAHPPVVPVGSAPHPKHIQWDHVVINNVVVPAAAGQGHQAVGDLPDHAPFRPLQPLPDPHRSLVGGVNYDPSIHHEENAPGGRTIPGIPFRLAGQREHGNVDAGGLAGCSGQRQSLRPGCLAPTGRRHPPGQAGLPRERIKPVELVEKTRQNVLR